MPVIQKSLKYTTETTPSAIQKSLDYRIKRVVVKIDSVDKSDIINFNSLEVRENLYSEANECYFVCEKYGSRSYVPAGGQEIGVWDRGIKIFGGKIINVKTTIRGKTLVYEVECKDWVDTLDGELATETYENMTVNAIIADLKANYATAFDITNVACTTVIEKIDFAAMPVSKCLDKLAKLTGYRWYVDSEKKIYFFVDGTLQSLFDLTDTNGNFISQSLKIEEDFSQIKNRVNVQGGSVANVQVSDATSIASYGEHEIIERDDALTSTDEATQKANAILTAYKDPIKKGSFETYRAGLRTGQEININSTLRSVNQNFIIKSILFSMRTPNDFDYDVEIMTQPDKSLMEFIQNQAMQPAPTPALGNTQFSTNIKFSITNYHEISWAAGTIIMSDGKEYSIVAGNQAFSGTNIIYFKPTTSETVLQFSATLANGMGSDRMAIGYCIENSNVALGAQMIPVGYHGGIRAWGGENIVARTVVADQIGLNCLVSNLVTTGEFITLTAQIKNAIIQDAHITGVISVGHTAAKCTDPNADQTSANPQAVSWLTDAGAMAYEDLVESAKLGTTVISGGYILASLLTATNIVAGTMNAARINGGDINGVTITGVTITGGTVRTNLATYPYVVMNSSGLTVHGQYMTFKGSTGIGYGQVYGSSTYGLMVSSLSGYNTYINGANHLNLNAGGSYLYLKQGDNAKIRISSTEIRPYVNIIPTTSTLSLGSSSYKWNTLYMNAGASIYWSGTSFYIRHIVSTPHAAFEINNNLMPPSDGVYNLGFSDRRFYDVRSVYINGSDYGFENDWWITESYKLDIKEKGLAILNKANKLVAFIGEKGFYSKKHIDISKLKYTLRTPKEREKITS